MQLTEQAHTFAQLILKQYSTGASSVEKDRLLKRQMEGEAERAKEKSRSDERFPLDYSKWNNIQDDDEKGRKKKHGEEDDPQQHQHMLGGHDRRKERDLFEKPTHDKLDAAERFKNEGNKLIAKGNYKGAVIEYDKALLQFHYTFPDTKDEEKRMEKLQEACHCNMALAKLNLKEYSEAINECSQALKINPSSRKASYRKSKAYLELFDFEKAGEVVDAVLKEEPDNKEFIGLKNIIQEDATKHKQQEKSLYQNMFK